MIAPHNLEKDKYDGSPWEMKDYAQSDRSQEEGSIDPTKQEIGGNLCNEY